jgi:hypothetical protein
VLCGRPPSLHGIVGIWYININASRETLSKYKINSLATPGVDTVAFSQVIAKISHAYASAIIRPENFEPLLTDFIRMPARGKEIVDHRRFHLVGGGGQNVAPTAYLHEIGLGLQKISGVNYLISRVRLLSFLGAPPYYAAVGTVPDAKRASVVSLLSNKIL